MGTGGRPRALTAAAILAFNALLLAVWTVEYHAVPSQIAASWRKFFLHNEFSFLVLFENWSRFFVGLLAALGLFSLAGLAGRRVASCVRPRQGKGVAGSFLVELCLGYGILGSATLAFGLVGLLFRPHRAVSMVVLVSAILLRFGRQAAQKLVIPAGIRDLIPTRLNMLTLGLFLVALLVTAAHVFNIEMGWDALTYHLRLPAIYLGRHRIFDVWHNFHSQSPAHVEMLFTCAMAFESDMAARFTSAILGILFACAVVSIGRSVKLPVAWPLLLVVGSPLFMLLVTRCYVDLAVGVYGCLAVMLFHRWVADSSMPSLVLSGLLSGWCMSSKYTAVLVPFALLAAAIPMLSARGRWRGLAFWAVCALVPLCVWLSKNYLLRGNPVSPFFSDIAGMTQDVSPDLPVLFGKPSEYSTMRTGLLGRLEALYLDGGHIQAPLLPAIAGLLPLLLLVRVPGRTVFLARFSVVFLAAWAFSCAEVRFLLPGLPFLALLLCSLSASVMERGGVAGSALRILLEVNIIAGALYGASLQWNTFSPFGMALGLESRRDKLVRGLPPQPFTAYTAEYVNGAVPPQDRILFVEHFTSYYFDRECITNVHFGKGRMTAVLHEYRTQEGVARRLRQLGIKWILSTGRVAQSFARTPGYFEAPAESWIAFKRFLATRAVPAFQTDYFTLYRLGLAHSERPLPGLPPYDAFSFDGADRALDEGRAAEALKVYAAPPPILADVGSTHLRRGLALNALRRFREAEAAFKRAAELGVDTPELNLSLAKALLAQGQTREAHGHALRAKSQNPLSAYACGLLAVIHAQAGDVNTARELTREAIRHDPANPLYRRIAGELEAGTR